MRSTCLFLAALGCSCEDARSPEVDTASKPPSPGTPAVAIEQSGVITCAQPAARTSAWFGEPKRAAEQPLSEANLVGGGMVLEDFDGDGIVDLFLPSESTVQLWWGEAGGLFACTGNGCTASQLDPSLHSIDGIDLSNGVGGSAADFDGDGDLDLLVTRWLEPVVLLRNDGGRVFTDVTATAGIGAHARRYQSASWGDFDGDGDLDVFLGTYGEYALILDDSCADHHGDGSELWRNEGDGTFTEVTSLLPPNLTDPVLSGYVFASGWYDVDDDGFPDLVVSSDDGTCSPSSLVHNDGGTSFTSSDLHNTANDMGLAVGDLNGDGLPDFAMTSYQSVSLITSFPLDSGLLYTESEGAYGLAVDVDSPTTQQVYGWGAEFGDVDNDGDLDLAMNFGWWQNFNGASDMRQQADGLWLQDAATSTFQDQAAQWGVDDPGISRAVILADLNGDGWLDVAKRMLDDDTKLYLSQCGSEGWLRLKLRESGPNTYAIGARVTVTAGGRTQTRWMQSGSSGQYTGSPLEVHFGLGAADAIDAIDVEWPDGVHTVTTGLASRQIVTLTRE